MTNCILLVSDQDYLIHLYPLLFSISKFVDADVAIRVHLINVNQSDYTFLSNTFVNVIFQQEKIELNKVRNKPTRYKEMPHLVGQKISDNHAYCNNKRYELIPLLLEQYENVLYIDVDNILRGNIKELFDLISTNDITIFKYEFGLHPVAFRKFMTYCCGIIGARNSEKSKRFFDDLYKKIVINGIFEIGDQMDFHDVFNESTGKIKLGLIPDKFKDYKLREDSIIWSGDGSIKHNPIYLLEVKKFYSV